MSRILFLEPIGGISGDLFLGAMADLGVKFEELRPLLLSIGLHGFSIQQEKRHEHGIGGTRVTVALDKEPSQEPAHRHGRTWREIAGLIERLPPKVGSRALAIFEGLAQVEAHIHGTSVDEVHFHEVGAIDSIVDIAGAAWCLEVLQIDRVHTRPPPLGSGITRSQHGVIPIPAPATLALLRNKPVLWEGRGEMTTPTGAAILAAMANFEPPVGMIHTSIGYGIGHANWEDRPNLLRASIGEAKPPESRVDDLVVLETHLDDSSPQLMGQLLDLLHERGALDASFSPLLMKKGRPGQRLTVVCRTDDRPQLIDLILRESTTLGVRYYPVEREELERRCVAVETIYGSVRIKLGERAGEVINLAPEYEDCLAAARSHGVPFKRVWAAALSAAQGLN